MKTHQSVCVCVCVHVHGCRKLGRGVNSPSVMTLNTRSKPSLHVLMRLSQAANAHIPVLCVAVKTVPHKLYLCFLNGNNIVM